MADITPIDVQAAPRPLPTPYADTPYSPQGFGDSIGSAVEQGADVLGNIAKDARDKATMSVRIGAVGAAKGVLNSTILDPQSGYFSLKGDDAIKQRDAYLQKFEDGINKIDAALPNNDVRLAFRQDVNNGIREDAYRHAFTHEAIQQEDLAKAAFGGSVDQSIQTMRSVVGSSYDLNNQASDLKGLATMEGQRRFPGNAAAIQSVVAPVMQKAAIDTMEQASVLGDPEIAKNTFDAVSPYLLNHERHYALVVSQMQRDLQVKQQAHAAVMSALEDVTLPGGSVISKINYDKLGPAMSGLSPEAFKVAEQEQTAREKLWSQSIGQVVGQAKIVGTLPDGSFSLARVPAVMKTWLLQNDPGDETHPGAIIALRGLEDREDARARALDRAEARQEYYEQRDKSGKAASGVSAQIFDKDHRDTLLRTSPGEFQSQLLKGLDMDGDPLPAPLGREDLSGLVKTYRQAQKDASANKLDERPEATVQARIALAADNDPDGIKQLNAQYFKVLSEKAHAFIANNKGATTTEKLEKYIDSELATGTVADTGTLFDDSGVRRVEAETLPKYRGKNFVPDDAGDDAGAQPVQNAKAVTHYRLSKDNKRRIPVYSDGSQGPIEANQ